MKAGAKLDEHLLEARTENALWLMSPRGGNLDLVRAARRLGLPPNTLEKHLDRSAPGWAGRLNVVRRSAEAKEQQKASSSAA